MSISRNIYYISQLTMVVHRCFTSMRTKTPTTTYNHVTTTNYYGKKSLSIVFSLLLLYSIRKANLQLNFLDGSRGSNCIYCYCFTWGSIGVVGGSSW